jgi:hypothetical protein
MHATAPCSPKLFPKKTVKTDLLLLLRITALQHESLRAAGVRCTRGRSAQQRGDLAVARELYAWDDGKPVAERVALGIVLV